MLHQALILTNLHAEEEEGSFHVVAVVLALRLDHLGFLRRRLRADEGRVPERKDVLAREVLEVREHDEAVARTRVGDELAR